VPQGSAIPNDEKHAVIVNEYGWLWLNRDGTPTTLTKQLYLNLLGPDSTAEQRLDLYARYSAAETEFWRVHRKVAAIMHFTTLGYSRPDGQTSDHWLDVTTLKWEPNFCKYVRDSFAPVGLCVKFWKDRLPPGGKEQIPVTVINDLDKPWAGPVTLYVKSGDLVITEARQDCRAEAAGLGDVTFDITLPDAPGTYILDAELRGADGRPVHSVRVVECENPATAVRAPGSAQAESAAQ